MGQRQIMFRCALLAFAVLAARPAILPAPPVSGDRSYAAGRFGLEINGERALVNSVEGGSAVGIIAVSGTDKRISGAKYEDIVFTVSPTNLPKPITEALDGKKPTVNGAIEYADFDYKVQRRVAFQDATVSAIRFPALDGASKDAATIEVTLSPQQTREESGGGGDIKGAAGASKQKQALRNAFRVVIPDVLTNRIATVSTIEMRAKASQSQTGAERIPTKEAPQYEIPNIKLTLSAADLKPWQQWLDKTLAEGGSKQEKTMRVELLEPSMKDAVASVDLSGVGIVAIRPQKAEANAESIQRVEIELYAEQVKFSPGPGGSVGGAKTATAAPPEAPPAEPAKLPTATPDRPIRRPR